MRIWSLHPCYLDAKGLVALWRETLLAQHVLLGKTRGYTQHPQLERFKAHADPLAAIGCYLWHVEREATARGYRFDAGKIAVSPPYNAALITVSNGQMAFEMDHLKCKLVIRDPKKHEEIQDIAHPTPHPLFTVTRGGVASWERI